MLFDKQVPVKLKETQQWFASIITTPIDDNNKSNPITIRGNKLAEEAQTFIAPSPTLKPHQRIELYNQQYWWRLLSNLQEAFPTLTRLFGHYDFNQLIAVPYLVKYPANSWSLNYLGDRLTQWIEEEYKAEDKQLILNSALIDCKFSAIFIAGKEPTIDLDHLPIPGEISSILNCKLFVQPYVEIFQMPYAIFEFRNQLVKEEPEYWIDNDFPKLGREKNYYYYILYRTKHNYVNWKEISFPEFFLLNCFKEGSTLGDACHKLEQIYSQNVDPSKQNDDFSKIASWFQEWIVKQWLFLKV